MKKLLAILLSVLLVLSLTACGAGSADESSTDGNSSAQETVSDEKKELSRGTINEDVYESGYSGLKFTKPESWVYSTDEEIAAAMNLGLEYLDADEKFAEALENNPSIYDMMVVDSVTQTNINIGYENLSLSFASNITEKQYVEALKNQFANMTAMEVEISDETKTVSLSGNDYLRVGSTVTANGVTMEQYYYLRKIDGYMNFVICTLVSGYEISDIEDMFK